MTFSAEGTRFQYHVSLATLLLSQLSLSDLYVLPRASSLAPYLTLTCFLDWMGHRSCRIYLHCAITVELSGLCVVGYSF